MKRITFRLLALGLSYGAASCGGLPLTLGGISSGGDKPKAPDATSAGSGDDAKPGPAASASVACVDDARLDGSRFRLDEALVPDERCQSAPPDDVRVSCLVSVEFGQETHGTVDLHFANGQTAHAHAAFCGGFVAVTLGGDVVRFRLSVDDAALTDVPTGRVFRRR